MPQPRPTTGNVEFLLDDLSDKMRATFDVFLWYPGDYSCLYDPRAKRLEVTGNATNGGELFWVSWIVSPAGSFLQAQRSGLNSMPVTYRQTGPLPLLFEFYTLYAQK